MTDTEKSAETEAKAKPKAATKKKAKPKAKPKSEAKPKAEAKTTVNAADVAPYLQKNSEPEPAEKSSSINKLAFGVVLVILVLTTAYKLNEELSNLPAQADAQKSSPNAEIRAAAMTPAAPASTIVDTKSPGKSGQHTTSAYATTHELANPPAQVRATNYNDIMQQRRQAYEKEMQLKLQQYKAAMETQRQERTKLTGEKKEELQRIRQNHLETRKKIEEIHEQITALHEQIHQIMRESYPQKQP